jgi:hypothetical protein
MSQTPSLETEALSSPFQYILISLQYWSLELVIIVPEAKGMFPAAQLRLHPSSFVRAGRDPHKAASTHDPEPPP